VNPVAHNRTPCDARGSRKTDDEVRSVPRPLLNIDPIEGVDLAVKLLKRLGEALLVEPANDSWR